MQNGVWFSGNVSMVTMITALMSNFIFQGTQSYLQTHYLLQQREGKRRWWGDKGREREGGRRWQRRRKKERGRKGGEGVESEYEQERKEGRDRSTVTYILCIFHR